MMVCNECQRTNTLDSKFCRGCGTPLDADAVAAARLENEELIAGGCKLLSESRFDEALMVANVALEADPVNVGAYSLRGDCLERKGDLMGAIEAYEKVIEFNPNSTLDRIKLTHIRNIIAERSAVIPKPSKRFALLAAICAIVFVASVGAIGAILTNGGFGKTNSGTLANNSEGKGSPMNPNGGYPGSNIGPGNTGQPNTPNKEQNPESKPDSRTKPNPDTDARTENPNSNPNRPTNPQLPDSRRETNTGEVRPFRPNVDLHPLPDANNGGTPNRPSNDPDPVAVDGGKGPAGGNTTPNGNGGTANPNGTGTKRNGTVDIRPSNGGTVKSGGGETTPPASGGSAADLVRQAREAMHANRYAEAAGLFERALTAGADDGINNQHLGSCYESLGRKADAVRAYSGAVAAYQRRIANGDSSSRTKSALDSAQQALNNLRG